MKVEIFSLCDAATVSGGKLNILGAFDSLYAPQTPVMHAQCAIALRLRFTRIEEGEHRLKFTIVNEDGRSVMPALEGVLQVKLGSDDDSAITNFIINIQQLKLENFGPYAIDLAVDARHEASLPLMVKMSPASSNPPQS